MGPIVVESSTGAFCTWCEFMRMVGTPLSEIDRIFGLLLTDPRKFDHIFVIGCLLIGCMAVDR
ncbi:hypothetical protein T4D_7757 [Trichinella pseudospiralis]|uniref:Uncharacterized protein n=1 Tax=Trichinella pseudospiralis TaxID=6337 RepID=A0A0V1F4M4_TRIPS|nr:hypothetical protein T4D_7757 [Trichinella pseudospiralis]